MKAFLMHRDRDFDFERPLPPNEDALTQDLELSTLWSAMAAGDPFLFEVAKRALLLGLTDPEQISYRQEVLTDCLQNGSLIRELYAMAGAALQEEKKVWSFLSETPSTSLRSSVQKMGVLLGFLRRLREMTDEHANKFRSPAFTRFFSMLTEELDQGYFQQVEDQLKALQFKDGLQMSARLSAGNKGAGYLLRQPREQSLLGRVFDRSGYSFTIPARDDNGFRALGELENRGTNLVANALKQAVDHVRSFFVMLRTEIGFYLGCVNLSERLSGQGEPTCLPVTLPRGEIALSGQGLYDVCLALTIQGRTVGNDVAADHKSLVMITGANQGGKSTLLRAIGLAQLMAQAGMFVAAESFRVNVCDGLFTHYKREEDEAMESGKLDEELSRMNGIAEQLSPNCMLLCNESFASTNEREGSEIARQIVNALLEERIKVLFVTHLFDLANSFYRQQLDNALFLRAERGEEGARPFKLSEGEPLPTSYGIDAYRKVFGKHLAEEPPSLRRSGGAENVERF